MNTWASLTARLTLVGLWLTFGLLSNSYEMFGRPARNSSHVIGWPLHSFDKGFQRHSGVKGDDTPASSRWIFVADNTGYPNNLHSLPLAYNILFFAVSCVMVWRCFNRRYGVRSLLCLCMVSASFLMVERYFVTELKQRLLFSTLGLYGCQLSLAPHSSEAESEFDLVCDPLAV